MRGALLIAMTAVALTMGVSSAHASTKMTKNFFVYSGTKFRRGGAESALLGSAGIVRKTFGKAYDYERKEMMTKRLMKNDGRLTIRRPARVRGTSVNEFAKNSMFKYLTFSVSDTIAQLTRGDLDLVKFEVSSHGDLVRAMNESPKYLDRLREISPKGKLRVVTAVWVVMSAKEYSDFSASLTGKMSMMGYTVEGDHTASSNGSWEIKKGTIFAYEFAKVDWDKGRKKITGLKVDKANM